MAKQVDAEEKYSSEHRVIEFKEEYETADDLETEARRFVQETQGEGGSKTSYQILISGKVIALALDSKSASIGELLLYGSNVPWARRCRWAGSRHRPGLLGLRLSGRQEAGPGQTPC